MPGLKLMILSLHRSKKGLSCRCEDIYGNKRLKKCAALRALESTSSATYLKV